MNRRPSLITLAHQKLDRVRTVSITKQDNALESKIEYNVVLPVVVSDVAHLLQGADGPGHRVDRLEGNNLRSALVHLDEYWLSMKSFPYMFRF